MNEQIVFEPSPKQLEFIQAAFSGNYRIILTGGSIRSGKSYCVYGTVLLLCKKYPGSRWAIVRDTLTTIKRNVLPSLLKIIPDSFRESYNQDTQVIRLTNGSEILLFAENYDEDKLLLRWRGLEVNGFVLEECNELQESSFYKAIERAGSFIHRENQMPPPLIFLTCNPSQGWVKTLFYDRWKNGMLPTGWLYLPLKITDNPYNTPEYLDSLKSMPRYEYEIFVEGNWELQMKTGGEWYKSFELDKHVAKCEYDPELAIHLSWDSNINPYLPAGVYQIKGTEIRMIAELIGITPRNTVKAVCDMFSSKYYNHNAGVFIYGDATEKKQDNKLEKGATFYTLILDYLKRFHPRDRVLRANPRLFTRGMFINAILETEKYGLKILIDPSCKTAIADFINVKEDSEGGKVKTLETDPKTGARQQAVGHLSDLFDYFIVSAFNDKFAAFQRGDGKFTITYGRNPGSRFSYDTPNVPKVTRVSKFRPSNY